MGTGGAEHVVIRMGAVAAALTAIIGLLVIAWKGGRRGLVFARRVVHLVDDVLGEPAHGSQPARPGWGDRLGAIEADLSAIKAEMHPNHGSSLRDVVDRVERRVERVEHRLDEHLAGHIGAPGR